MIIIGYPGVGKTTMMERCGNICREKGYKSVIDLESSAFNMLNDELGFVDINGRPCKSNNWAEVYCRVAAELSDQGHLVFVSSHADVQKQLRACMTRVCVVCPAVELKQEWLERLRTRYLTSADDEKNKNLAAYSRACDHYEKDIEALKSNGFELLEITEMYYSLEDLIFGEGD